MNSMQKLLITCYFILSTLVTHCAWHLGPQCDISPKTTSSSTTQPSHVVYNAIYKNKLQPFTPLKEFQSPEIILSKESFSVSDRLKIVKDLQHARKNGPDRKKLLEKISNLSDLHVDITNNRTHKLSNLQLENIIHQTYQNAQKHGRKRINKKDYWQAYADCRYGTPQQYFLDEKTVTYHELGHALGDILLTNKRILHYVSNEKRKDILGHTLSWYIANNSSYDDLLNHARVDLLGIITQQYLKLPSSQNKFSPYFNGEKLVKKDQILDLLLSDPIASSDIQEAQEALQFLLDYNALPTNCKTVDDGLVHLYGQLYDFVQQHEQQLHQGYDLVMRNQGITLGDELYELWGVKKPEYQKSSWWQLW